MKQAADKYTIDAFNKSSRSRPRKSNAKSPAQRQREYLQRLKFNFLISVTRDEKSKEIL
ncbi:hypothetical protein ACO0K7_19005 [Undibacterium sp. Ji67W]|uniref:hypothetical protein n=1 Tax=Undibacterium sp. Ji67W TaxID=3413042 RepID=UPI003BF246D6